MPDEKVVYLGCRVVLCNMKSNESALDRVIRVTLGGGMVVVAYRVMTSWWSVLLYTVGIVLIITGLTGFCTFYELFGYSSKKPDDNDEKSKKT